MDNTITIRVSPEDVKIMRSRCRELFLKDNPKFCGYRLSDKFMFKKLVEFYLD